MSSNKRRQVVGFVVLGLLAESATLRNVAKGEGLKPRESSASWLSMANVIQISENFRFLIFYARLCVQFRSARIINIDRNEL